VGEKEREDGGLRTDCLIPLSLPWDARNTRLNRIHEVCCGLEYDKKQHDTVEDFPESNLHERQSDRGLDDTERKELHERLAGRGLEDIQEFRGRDSGHVVAKPLVNGVQTYSVDGETADYTQSEEGIVPAENAVGDFVMDSAVPECQLNYDGDDGDS